MTLTIIYEDTHIIVTHKPAGIATQTRRVGEPDMVSLLKNHISQGTSRKHPPYLAVIHRLDQPVEGLLVFAKTPLAAKELNRQLQQKGFGKHYKALLCGTPVNEQGILTDYLVKDNHANISAVCNPETPNAKKAVLHYCILLDERVPDAALSLAGITLNTGRHHQIRVQMAHLGCPILGDTKYNPRPFLPGARTPLALCADKLTFLHPKTQKQMLFEITPAFLKHDKKP